MSRTRWVVALTCAVFPLMVSLPAGQSPSSKSRQWPGHPAHGRRAAGFAGLLDQRLVHAARAASGVCRQVALHAAGSGGVRAQRGSTGSRTSHAPTSTTTTRSGRRNPTTRKPTSARR